MTEYSLKSSVKMDFTWELASSVFVRIDPLEEKQLLT